MKRKLILKRGKLQVMKKIPVVCVLRILRSYKAHKDVNSGSPVLTSLKLYEVMPRGDNSRVNKLHWEAIPTLNEYAYVYDVDTHVMLELRSVPYPYIKASHFYLKVSV